MHGGILPPERLPATATARNRYPHVMNWLAHVVLSEYEPAFRVGNVLADLLPMPELRHLPAPFLAGIARHRAIDLFTDRHPVFRASRARLSPPFRRYSGVIVDVFYDHLLSASWSQYSTVALPKFVADFHSDVDRCRADLPLSAYAIFLRMRLGNWLQSYGDTAGVELTLRRISKRLRRPFDLSAATADLENQYPAFTQDFADFFPQIRTHFAIPAPAAT
jgi:acyl carrier protein phosphodiesterase